MSSDGTDELDGEVMALLADPATWVEPPPGLADAVVAAVGAAARNAHQPADAVETQPASRWRRRRSWALGAAAAAVVLIAGFSVALLRDGGDTAAFEATLEPTELLPGAAGSATLAWTESGWLVHLDATGLPRLDDGRFYQAWLQADGGALVPIGTFNEGTDVTLWAGVAPDRFPTLAVTEESDDGDQDPSGRTVLVGTVVATS